MINVLVVDDQNFTHRLIETYLEPETDIKIVGFAEDGQAAIDQVQSLKPDIVLMDVEMPRMDGLKATKIITQNFIATKVLILSVHDNEQHLSKALRSGAKGYLLKTTTAQELSHAIHYVNQGYFQLSLELTEKYLHKIAKSQSEVQDNSEFSKKLNYLYKSLNKLESNFKKISGNNQTDIDPKIEGIIQKAMASLNERDSHLQFKVDRMKYNQKRLENKLGYLFKIQIGCIIFFLIAIFYSIYSNH
jgi:DNA-binding NarL/FixJ family response regulator